MIVAEVPNGLRFRVFDEDGKMVVDADETSADEKGPANRCTQVSTRELWPPHDLTRSEAGQLRTDIKSIVAGELKTKVRAIGIWKSLASVLHLF